MELYLVRHGIAVDRDDPACPAEEDRYLTEEGRRRLGFVAEALRRMEAAPDLLLSSPWLRARQTAELAGQALGVEEFRTRDCLLPFGRPAELLALLEELAGEGVSSVLAAGHEPHMSRTVSWLASGGSLRVEMKKGSVAHLDVHLRDRAPAATLRWLMTPKLARRLVKGRE